MTCTVAEIEREVAARLGPFYVFSVAASPAPTTTLSYVSDIKSSIDLGGFTDQYLLRRGRRTDGTAIAGFATGDRVRSIKTYDTSTGYLEVDRIYATACISTEEVEVHLLNPKYELRAAVLAALRRCYIEDRVSVTLTGTSAERNLTTLIPWLVGPSDVLRVGSTYPGSLFPPTDEAWYEAFQDWDAVWLNNWPDAYPSTKYITARRRANTLVNQIDIAIPTLADVTTGGNLAANTRYYAAVVATGQYGDAVASNVVSVLTANDGLSTHSVRVTLPIVTGAVSYKVYMSTDNPPLLVATPTEVQRLAAGCIITASNTVSNGGTNLTGTIDVRLVGTQAAVDVTQGPLLDTDVLPIDLDYAAAAAHIECWRRPVSRVKLAASSAMGMAPSMKDAAAEFSRVAALRVNPSRKRVQLGEPLSPDFVSGW